MPSYLLHPSPIGMLLLGSDGTALCECDLAAKRPFTPLDTPPDSIHLEAARQLDEWFAGKRREFTVPLRIPDYPPFRARVLSELAKVEYGDTVTYGELAARCSSKAYRAVGSACATNPLLIFIPCHRVLPASATIASPGYFSAGGENVKRYLLEMEQRMMQQHNGLGGGTRG